MAIILAPKGHAPAKWMGIRANITRHEDTGSTGFQALIYNNAVTRIHFQPCRRSKLCIELDADTNNRQIARNLLSLSCATCWCDAHTCKMTIRSRDKSSDVVTVA